MGCKSVVCTTVVLVWRREAACQTATGLDTCNRKLSMSRATDPIERDTCIPCSSRSSMNAYLILKLTINITPSDKMVLVE
jgi:hypothetical protein